MESIPIGIRIAIGLLQACAVRAAGFATVAIAGLAPAVKYVIPNTCQPITEKSQQGALRYHDVHFSLSHRHVRTKHQCLRGAKSRTLWS